MSTEITRQCDDGSPHIFLSDGSAVTCAYCDLDFEAWLAKFYPAIAALEGEARADALKRFEETPPC